MKRAINELLRLISSTVFRGKADIERGGRRPTTVMTTRGGEKIEAVRLQNFGMASRPPVPHETVGVCLSGRRGGAVVVISDANRTPAEMQAGETAIYSSADNPAAAAGEAGCRITLMANGDINIDAPGRTVAVRGDITVAGDITVTGDVRAGAVSLRNHVHHYRPGSGSQTDTATAAESV